MGAHRHLSNRKEGEESHKDKNQEPKQKPDFQPLMKIYLEKGVFSLLLVQFQKPESLGKTHLREDGNTGMQMIENLHKYFFLEETGQNRVGKKTATW